MPKLNSSLPKYRLHRASGQAVVTLYGKDIYLGPWRSKASKLEYDRLIREWVAAGRPTRQVVGTNDITVVELAAAYQDYAKGYYRKNGKTTDTIYQLQQATAVLECRLRAVRIFSTSQKSSRPSSARVARGYAVVERRLSYCTLAPRIGRTSRLD
jgi:hypothetical protein